MPDNTVTLISWNVEKGFHTDQACAWLADQRPDVVLWQELQHPDLERVQDTLGMRGYPGALVGASANSTAIFLAEDGPFTVQEIYDHTWAPWIAPANVTVTWQDSTGASSRPLNLVSQHACYYSADIRLREADWLTALAKPGWLTLAAGDWNSYTADDPHPRWHVTDRAFYTNRTYLQDGIRCTDDRPDRTLTAAGYVDAGRWAASHLGHGLEPLRPTAGYGKPHQGGLARVDRTYLVRELAPALRRVTVADTPELRAISDHLPTLVQLDAHRLAAIMNRPQPEPAHTSL